MELQQFSCPPKHALVATWIKQAASFKQASIQFPQREKYIEKHLY